jgi:hypothetical protein
MKRFIIALALALALSGSVFAGDITTSGSPAPGEIPTSGAPAPGDIPSGSKSELSSDALSALLSVLSFLT